MKLRLIMRNGQSDGDGTFVGFTYSSYIVDVPIDLLHDKPEIIGGEWLPSLAVLDSEVEK